MARRERRALYTWMAVGLAGSAWLSATMPADGFFSGDSGVKLIAARNAINHPDRPLDIDLPRIGGRPVPYVDRFFEIYEDHAYALQSPVFPLLSALPIAAVGLRGAYLLPLLAFVCALLPLDAIRRLTDRPSSAAWLAVIAVLANPVFFYALEFWEHAPAVVCVAAATALALPRGGRIARSRLVAAGAAVGVAILLRPEAIWYGIALTWLTRQQGTRAVFGMGVGAAAVLAPFAAVSYAYTGSMVGPHVAANLAPLGDHWLAARAERIRLWLLPWAPAGALGLALMVTAWIGPIAANQRRRQTLALIGGVVVTVAAIRGAFSRESLWTAWPVATLLFVPCSGTDGTRRLWLLSGFSIVAIWLSSTHDGGAQWGPRFLLIATPPLLVLSARAAGDATGAGDWHPLRVALVTMIVIGGIWTTRGAYREVRNAKRYYAHVVDTTASVAAPGAYLISDAWWFDQVVAALYGTRTFLYVRDPPAASTVLNDLAAAGVSDATLVWTRDGRDGEPLNDAVVGTCYRITSVREVPESNLTFARAECYRSISPVRIR